MLKTNYLFHLENFFNDSLQNLIPKLEEKLLENRNIQSKYFTENFITNPILKFFLKCARTEGDKRKLDMSRISISSGASKEFVYVKFLGNLINYLNFEINKNQDYKNELIKNLLARTEGVFYKTFCELLIGGFLKFNSFQIKFNSSKQKGLPDVITIKPYRFANEAKTFPDLEYWLKDKIDKHKKAIISFLKNLQGVEITIMITNLEKFDMEFPILFSKFLETGISQNGESLLIIYAPFYIGNQGYVVDFIPNKSSIRFIPNFALDEKSLQKIADKAENQFKNQKLDGVLWLSFPHPKEADIEKKVIGLVSSIPKNYMKKNLGMVLFNFEAVSNIDAYRGGIKFSLDIFNINKKFNFINNEEFGKFTNELINSPLLFVS